MARTLKFAKGGRADRMRERRMADIEKDYKIALAKGKSEKEARAKRDQRIADAKDDYAKRTGADRTETRAAEKAAEARLSAARRSPDKDIKPVGVASEGPATTKVDTSAKVDTPRVFQASEAKPKAATKPRVAAKPKPKVNAEPKPATPKPTYDPAALRRLEAEVTRPNRSRDAKPVSPGKYMIQRSAQRQQAQVDELGRDFGKVGSAISRFFAGKNRDKPKGYAVGGKIDGAAVRGKTKLRKGK